MNKPLKSKVLTPIAAFSFSGMALLGYAISPDVALAATLVSSNVSYRVYDGATDNQFSSSQPAQTSNNNQPLSASAVAADRGTGGNAAASSALGVLKAASTAGAIGVSAISGPNQPFTTSTAHADASASWSDDVPILAPGQSGSGIARIALRVDASIGSLWADGSVTAENKAGGGQAFAGADFQVNHVSLFSFRELVSQQGYVSSTTTILNGAAYPGSAASFWADVAGNHYLDIPFTFGTPLSLYAFSNVYADAGAAGRGATGNGYADLGNSIYWGGIVSVTDSNGLPVTGFTALGTTGHNWQASAVPVPAAAWLFGSGLLGLFGVARRRSR